MERRRFPRLHLTTWLMTAFVLLGAWNAQTDGFPIPDMARPSWYVYGWPVCFGNSSRGRCRLHRYPFDSTALLFDLMISGVAVVTTVYTTESLVRRFPRLSVLDMLAMVTGMSLMCFMLSSGFVGLLEQLLGAVPPPLGLSAMAGNVRYTSAFGSLGELPLALGLASIGFALFKLPFSYAHQDHFCRPSK